MTDFLKPEDITKKLYTRTCAALEKKTKRNGNSIALTPIIYNCIRAVYFEIMDYPTKIMFPEEVYPWLTIVGPAGTSLHKVYQNLFGLTEQPHTEKLYTFNMFKPLQIKSKCDGIDVEKKILYEFKTKDGLLDSPDENEFSQGLFSAWLFHKELKVEIQGYTMVYIDRGKGNFKLFHYDLKDKESEYYYNATPIIRSLVKKVQDLVKYVTAKTPPPMDHEWIKKYAFGRSNCRTCPYSASCEV